MDIINVGSMAKTVFLLTNQNVFIVHNQQGVHDNIQSVCAYLKEILFKCKH